MPDLTGVYDQVLRPRPLFSVADIQGLGSETSLNASDCVKTQSPIKRPVDFRNYRARESLQIGYALRNSKPSSSPHDQKIQARVFTQSDLVRDFNSEDFVSDDCNRGQLNPNLAGLMLQGQGFQRPS